MISQLLINIKDWLKRFEERREEGQGLLEYALIILLIIIIVIVALSPLGQEIRGIFNQIVTSIQSYT
jgi:pilus assembly protein Flp/PilA